MTAILPPKTTINQAEMELRDVVAPLAWIEEGRPWPWHIVKRISDGLVHLYRPYGISHEVQYSGPSVLCYMGLEEYSISAFDTERRWVLAERSRTL